MTGMLTLLTGTLSGFGMPFKDVQGRPAHIMMCDSLYH